MLDIALFAGGLLPLYTIVGKSMALSPGLKRHDNACLAHQMSTRKHFEEKGE